MPICPKCEADINCLAAPSIIHQRYVMVAGGELLEEQGIDPLFPETAHFDCPECDAELFTDMDDANSFLMESR